MRRILLYVEPHPIRNHRLEFYDVGLMLADVLARCGRDNGYDFRVLSNNAVIDRLIVERPELATVTLRPTAAESAVIESFFDRWTETAIIGWLGLVRGEGQAAAFYRALLERVATDEYDFDGILLWSDNGAVRRFAADHGKLVIHGEYGPTRAPFHRTVYFDPDGTNGAAAVLRAPLKQLSLREVLPVDVWRARQSCEEGDAAVPGLADGLATFSRDAEGAPRLPHPYVYVPLQLADDLNTLRFSRFASPEDFLRQLIPVLRARGLGVVVKGHPMAEARPHNLVLEMRALAYARGFGDDVVVLPRDLPARASIHAAAQSVAVVSINSSVSFESILLGKPALVLGQAVFGLAGMLDVDIASASFPAQAETATDAEIARLVSFLCGHYFIPIDAVTKGRALIDVLDYLFSRRGHAAGDPDFWQGWINNCAHGFDWLAGGEAVRSVRSGAIAGNQDVRLATGRQIAVSEKAVTVVGILPGGQRMRAVAALAHDRFLGFIDHVEHIEEKGEAVIEVSGWCVERETMRPPTQIFLCDGGKIVSHHRLIVERPDVLAKLDSAISIRCGFRFRVADRFGGRTDELRLLLLSSMNVVQRVELRPAPIHGVG